MADIFSYMIAGNNIVQYVLFLGILAATFFGTKIIYYIFSKVFHALTKKTTSRLDDIIVDALQKPVIFAVFLGGLQYGKQVLTLSETASSIYGHVLMALVVVNIAWFVIRISTAILENYLHPEVKGTKFKMEGAMYHMLKRIIVAVIYAIALIIILQNLDVKVTGLVAGLGIGGLAFALAAQDIIGNMFGGAAVIVDKPFQVGDRVKVAGQDGFVSKISLRSTTLETFSKTHVVMPNKMIADSVLENVSRENMRRERVVVGLEYDTSAKDLEKAKKILTDIILKNDKTDDDSLVHFVNFGPSSLDLQVLYWIKDLDAILGTKDEVHMAIKKAFDKEGLSFAFPTQTLHVHKAK
ncbi:MAG: mechanosensitive ion channel family protein [Nanobdellota archaeon]